MTASTRQVWRRNQCVRQQHQRGEANHSARLCFLPPASLSRQHFAAIISHLLRAESWKMWLVLTGVATDVFVCIQTCGVWLWWPDNSDACKWFQFCGLFKSHPSAVLGTLPVSDVLKEAKLKSVNGKSYLESMKKKYKNKEIKQIGSLATRFWDKDI